MVVGVESKIYVVFNYVLLDEFLFIYLLVQYDTYILLT